MKRGAIAWMAANPVAANLFMGGLILGGLFMSREVRQEVFPEIALDIVNITVPYPGASPEEVEQGIALVVEEAVRGITGVKMVRSRAFEGVAAINVEMVDGADKARVLNDVKSAVDSIRNLPVEAERPRVSESVARQRVVTLVIYGDKDEEALRRLAETTRERLLADPRVTQVDLGGVRPREVSVEVSEAQLRAHGLSLGGIADRIRRSSVELPGGTLKTPSGETLLRTTERRDLGAEFADIELKSDSTGMRLRVGDVAEVEDGFREADLSGTFEGLPSVQVEVYRVGDQTPIEVADAVYEYIEETEAGLPLGVQYGTWRDRSQMYRQRIDLLLRNAYLGLILVFVILGLFLELRLAFWVMLGIPISFLGAFLLMPSLDVSLNMISLFAFIVTLGIVVDDAIVVGENIFEKRKQGMDHLEAAIAGAKQVAVPVTFAILTTIVAFAPLFFVPGVRGKFFRVIPAIVIAVIFISLIESLFVLPAHLAHSKPKKAHGLIGAFNRQHAKIGAALQYFVDRIYTPVLRFCARERYLTLAIAVGLFLVSVGMVKGGHLRFTFMPKIEGDNVKCSARLPVGVPFAEAVALRDRLTRTAVEVLEEAGGREALSKGVIAQVGEAIFGRRFGGQSAGGAHIVEAAIQLVPSDAREVRANEIAKRWREANKDLVGLEKIGFTAELRHGGGLPIDVQLQHADVAVLRMAAERLATEIQGFEGVDDVDDGFAGGKKQLDLRLLPAGRAAGLTEIDLARQLRGAFYGAEAVRQQRGRDEVRVMVRRPQADRQALATLENLLLRTPAGGEIPLAEAAIVTEGRAYTEIVREDGRRVINVTADTAGRGNARRILSTIGEDVLPALIADYPGLTHSLEGQSRESRETFGSLGSSFLLALFVIYGLLAIPFRSYVQPAIIMIAIPFGFVGAVAGHLLMGYDLSVISMMGIVALSGIVVNDSLILIMSVNEYRAEGASPHEAVVAGARRRFRPILLTTLTTFFGLLPMIFEPSVQARFLIPMAISLGFGVLFATGVILLLVPAVYLIVEDERTVRGFVAGLYRLDG